MEYIYDIFLDDALVGDSGDEIFDDKTQAKLDAEDYINYLSEEYDRPDKDFEIMVYEKFMKRSFNMQSLIIGFMLKHTDGDMEYYEPKLTDEDQDAIYKILDKYGDDNESIRGTLKVINTDY